MKIKHRLLNFSKLIVIPFFLASSIRFTTSITLGVIFRIWMAKLRLLSRRTALQITTVTSTLSSLIKLVAISSSFDVVISEYVPGKSYSSWSSSLYL